MGHERQVGPFSKDSHISPNGEGLLFSSNPPPFDPLKENLSDQDKHDSNNGIPSTETRIADLLNRQSGRILPFMMVGLGAGAGGTGLGIFLGTEIIASEENPSQTETLGSVPGGTSFDNNSRLIIPSDETKANKDGVFDQSKEKFSIDPRNAIMIPLTKYLENPPPLIEGNNINIALIGNITEKGEIVPLKVTQAKDWATGGLIRVTTDTGNIKEEFVNNDRFIDGYKKGNIFGIVLPEPIYDVEIYYMGGNTENPRGTLPKGGGITIEGHDKDGKNIVILINFLVPVKLIPEMPRFGDYTGVVREKEVCCDKWGNIVVQKETGQIKQIPKVPQFIGGPLFEILDSKPTRNSTGFRGQIMLTTAIFNLEHGRFEGGEHNGEPRVGGAAEIKFASTSSTGANTKAILIDPSSTPN